MAALATRLLTDFCADQVRAVIKTDQGPQALHVAFEASGQFAIKELMADKTVQNTRGAFVRHLDQTRINEVMAGK